MGPPSCFLGTERTAIAYLVNIDGTIVGAVLSMRSGGSSPRQCFGQCHVLERERGRARSAVSRAGSDCFPTNSRLVVPRWLFRGVRYHCGLGGDELVALRYAQ